MSFPRDGFSGVGAAAALDEPPEPFRVLLAPAHVDEGADDGPHHVAQEAVGPHREHHVVPFFCGIAHLGHMDRAVCLPACFVDRADRSEVVPPCLLEAAEVMLPEQQGRRAVHLLHVERIDAEVREAVHERVFPPVYEVVVFPRQC